MAKAAGAATPRTERAAAEKNAFRDCGSAFKADDGFSTEAGAKAVAADIMEARTNAKSFMVKEQELLKIEGKG